MQKIFDDCYELDKRCYEKFNLTEDILMEHAALGLEKAVKSIAAANSKVLIVAGPGNNGADGITLARLLQGDYNIYLYLPYGAKSPMAKLQLERARQLGLDTISSLPGCADVVVDALFGAGFSKALDIKGMEIINSLNDLGGFKLACDIPSGLDRNGNPNPIAFKADLTVTMGALKKALLSDYAKQFTGDIEVVNLGVGREFYEHHTRTFMVEKEDFNPPLRNNPATHKGNFGHLCIVAGEKSGAAVLCGSAALRFGTGLVTLIGDHDIPNRPFSIMQSKNLPQNTTAVAIGMGLGIEYDPIMIKSAITENDIPVLLDADVCYAPWVKELLERCSKSVITPHPKEFAALLKTLEINEDADVYAIQQDRFGWARRFSEAYPKSVLVLKGANTLIACEGAIYVNTLGTPVLSQAGSGDILSGLIASLLAQGYTPLNAAINGSLAQTLCARNYKGADFSATAEDLIEEIRWLKV